MTTKLNCTLCQVAFERNIGPSGIEKIKKGKKVFCSQKCQAKYFSNGRKSPRKGLTWEQYYGGEKANKIRNKMSNSVSGDKNHQYGKPGYWNGKERPDMSGEKHPFYNKKRPEFSEKFKGKNHWSYNENAVTKKKYFCKICNASVTYASAIHGKGTCVSCAAKGKNKGRKPSFSGKRYYYKQNPMRSNWEVKYAKWLDKNNIKWEYEPKAFDLGDCTYRPDFHLLETNKWVEVKGYWTEIAKKKVKLFKKLYPNVELEIIETEGMKKLGLI